MTNESASKFQDVKTRLDEIVELVSDDSLSLDEALKLYEEAVALGLQATNLLEQDIAENNEAFDEKENNSDSETASAETAEGNTSDISETE